MQATDNPENTIFNFKQFLGKTYVSHNAYYVAKANKNCWTFLGLKKLKPS